MSNYTKAGLQSGKMDVLNNWGEHAAEISDLYDRYIRHRHSVCAYCVESCRQPYTPWSWQMPGNIYCENFKESRFASVEMEYVLKEWVSKYPIPAQ